MHSRLLGRLILLLGSVHKIGCSPTTVRTPAAVPHALAHGSNPAANLTHLLASIPPDFNIEHELYLPFSYPLEACFTNLVAVLGDVALGDFAGNMANTYYRTARFAQPVIKINSPSTRNIPRRYVVWGTFLTAFYLHKHNACHMGFFVLQWKDQEVAGIGITSSRPAAGQNDAVRMPPPASNNDNENVKIDIAFFGGPKELGAGAVYMTIIASMMEAAPQASSDRIHETVINYLPNEPATFIVTPTAAARADTGPSFTNAMLIDLLARAADFYAEKGIYRQLGLNASIGGVVVAQAAFARRENLGALGWFNGTEVREQAGSIA
ncbi:MAG: hypothetical protein LQ346_004118 [Caloplaca aetnensis]|nr:MAG: hypothetical protein LQ346_004118 [Caloplaca aetnensis]